MDEAILLPLFKKNKKINIFLSPRILINSWMVMSDPPHLAHTPPRLEYEYQVKRESTARRRH
jgi:hypothetical protein